LRQVEISQKSNLAHCFGLFVVTKIGGDIGGAGDVQSCGVVQGVEEVVLESNGKRRGSGINERGFNKDRNISCLL